MCAVCVHSWGVKGYSHGTKQSPLSQKLVAGSDGDMREEASRILDASEIHKDRSAWRIYTRTVRPEQTQTQGLQYSLFLSSIQI